MVLQDMRSTMFSSEERDNIEVHYRLIHAMANSDSERTLVAVFAERQKSMTN